MPALNFKELPEAHISSGMQDTFELFARDFFKMIGLNIVSGPDRGQDGGRDLLAIETRGGIVGITEIKWLVSCKHKAHSGESVKDKDELDILDRVKAYGANGFIGFYSTVISAPLSRKLEGLKSSIEVKIFDHEMIEHELLNTPIGKRIAKRYMPLSYNKWENTWYSPSNIFTEYEPLNCKYCGEDLLNQKKIEKFGGIIVFVSDIKFMKEHNFEKEKIMDVYWACKGKCDHILENRYRTKGGSTGWEDISDIVIPSKYLNWNMSILNGIQSGHTYYEEKAFKNLREFIVKTSQITLKQQTEEQINRLKILSTLPEGM